jgi:hypothetical protein
VSEQNEPCPLFSDRLDFAQGRGVFMTVLGHTLAHAVQESFAMGHRASDLCAFVDGSDLAHPIVQLWTRESFAARAPGLRGSFAAAPPCASPAASLIVIVSTMGKVSSFEVPLSKGKAHVSG